MDDFVIVHTSDSIMTRRIVVLEKLLNFRPRDDLVTQVSLIQRRWKRHRSKTAAEAFMYWQRTVTLEKAEALRIQDTFREHSFRLGRKLARGGSEPLIEQGAPMSMSIHTFLSGDIRERGHRRRRHRRPRASFQTTRSDLPPRA